MRTLAWTMLLQFAQAISQIIPVTIALGKGMVTMAAVASAAAVRPVAGTSTTTVSTATSSTTTKRDIRRLSLGIL